MNYTDPKPKLPTIAPRVGFRYKLRNGMVTQRMQKNGNVFINVLIDANGCASLGSWYEDGCYYYDQREHDYDIIEELPIEWSDFEVVSASEKDTTLKFGNFTIKYHRNNNLYNCNLHRDSDLLKICDAQDALNIIRSHFARPQTELEQIKAHLAAVTERLARMEARA